MLLVHHEVYFNTCCFFLLFFCLCVCVCVHACMCRFILAACDGLWKVFGAEEAAQFILKVLEVVPF